MMENICAISTPYGVGAISIIRASGPDSISLVNKIFKGCDLTKVKSHTINYGHIIDDKGIVDEVLCNVYLKPNSFDGENMVEINCHGGIYVTNRVLSLLLENGFRMAMPGEFSKRAFINHKIDLTQSEAIMDIISSSNDIALRSSNDALRKSTLKLIKSFRDDILDVIAKIEVNIDYPEYEDSVDVTHNYLKPIVDDMIEKMKVILDNSKISTIAIHGVKTAIIGRPNVGKSSLLNMMLDEDKAIVSNIPGTTRDLVEGTLTIGNVTLNLVDTAGIHETKDLVESIGIKRSKEALDSCDLVLLVLDSSEDLKEEDKYLIKITENKNRIVILNKSDLKSKIKFDNAISISALKNEGMDLLAKKILEITSINNITKMDGNYLNNIRQIDLMDKAYNSIIEAYDACLNLVDISLIEIDIKKAFDLLGEITGESYEDELLDALFTKFCLGK
jgi:tRNA modification GTPase